MSTKDQQGTEVLMRALKNSGNIYQRQGQNRPNRDWLSMDTALPLASHALALAGVLTFVAALAHLACILIGAPAYRLMGAGEKMAQAATAGNMQAAVLTFAIALVLAVWGAYALSGAGLVRALPFAKVILVAICAVFLLRAFAFPLLKPLIPENSNTFWLVSSGICFLIGSLYLYGIIGSWKTL